MHIRAETFVRARACLPAKLYEYLKGTCNFAAVLSDTHGIHSPVPGSTHDLELLLIPFITRSLPIADWGAGITQVFEVLNLVGCDANLSSTRDSHAALHVPGKLAILAVLVVHFQRSDESDGDGSRTRPWHLPLPGASSLASVRQAESQS